ncbi:unnamed protein product [Clavelina lepadiformis]|uniref:Secreted protein n=1 Tax=Clavelina lepadiformis TaxID=159417 RepID=A0ABP0GR90_CLALP
MKVAYFLIFIFATSLDFWVVDSCHTVTHVFGNCTECMVRNGEVINEQLTIIQKNQREKEIKRGFKFSAILCLASPGYLEF